MWVRGSKAGSKRYTDRRREHELGGEDGEFDTSYEGVAEVNRLGSGDLGVRLSQLPPRLAERERLPLRGRLVTGLAAINGCIARC